MNHHNSELSLVVEGKSNKHLDHLLIDLKGSALGKLNKSFSFGGWCCEVSRKVVCAQC